MLRQRQIGWKGVLLCSPGFVGGAAGQGRSVNDVSPPPSPMKLNYPLKIVKDEQICPWYKISTLTSLYVSLVMGSLDVR